MKTYEATEQAYKNGYEDGKRDAVKHGRWEQTEHYGFLRCSNCKDVYIADEWITDGKWSYCPNCGAKMDGDG